MRLLLTILLFCFSSYVHANCDSNTKLLLHFNESDASTTTVDENCDASGAKTVIANGDVQTDSGVTKFTNTALFDGTGDYWTLADNAAWDVFGSTSGDYTVDFWVKHVSTAASQAYVAHGVLNGTQWFIRNETGGSGNLELRVYDGGATDIALDCTGFTDTNWHHVALVKVANEYAFYKDGADCDYVLDNDTLNLTGLLYIGRRYDLGGEMYFNGNMDEMHIQASNHFSATPTSGLTDTITVPTSEYAAAGGGSSRRIWSVWNQYIPLEEGGYRLEQTVYNFIPKSWVDG